MMISHFKLERMSRQIQQQISVLYDLLTNNNDFSEIRHWLVNTSMGQNENFVAFNYQLNIQRQVARKDLNKLSETTEEIQALVNQCRQLVLIEKEKDENLKKHYKQYSKKTEKQDDNKRNTCTDI
jgi:septum formation inhibitor MinC